MSETKGLREPITATEREAYRTRGDIQFPVPPVCTAFWDEDAWIKWYRCGPNFNKIVAEMDAAKQVSP